MKRLGLILLMCVVALLAGCSEASTGGDAQADAIATPAGEKVVLAYLTSYNEADRTMKLDEVEWVSISDIDRVNVLISKNVITSKDDLPNGYYIYNEAVQQDEYKVSDNVTVEVDSTNGGDNLKNTMRYVTDKVKLGNNAALFHVTILDDRIVKLEEQYRP